MLLYEANKPKKCSFYKVRLCLLLFYDNQYSKCFSPPPDLLISHLSNLRKKKNNPINQNPENPIFFSSAMPLCSPCPTEQNTLALARSVMRPRARADGPWGKQTRPLAQTHLGDLGLEVGGVGGRLT